jgi:hypothetical protein
MTDFLQFAVKRGPSVSEPVSGHSDGAGTNSGENSGGLKQIVNDFTGVPAVSQALDHVARSHGAGKPPAL